MVCVTLGDSAEQGQDLDSVIFVGPFGLSLFCDSGRGATSMCPNNTGAALRPQVPQGGTLGHQLRQRHRAWPHSFSHAGAIPPEHGTGQLPWAEPSLSSQAAPITLCSRSRGHIPQAPSRPFPLTSHASSHSHSNPSNSRPPLQNGGAFEFGAQRRGPAIYLRALLPRYWPGAGQRAGKGGAGWPRPGRKRARWP